MIRLIATDLDGTLLEKDGKLPEGIFEVIEELRQKGIWFAAASGRQYGNLARLFAPVSEQMAFICENGAYCVVRGNDAGTIALSSEVANEIISDIQKMHMNPLISGKHTCYMFDTNRKYTDDIVYRLRNTVTIISSLSDISEPILKISGQIDSGVADLAPELIRKWGNRLTATVSGRDWFDFTIANKGMGIKALVDYLGINKEEVVAFGDNFNDESMLDYVGYPFIMEQAHPQLHKDGYHTCRKVLPVLRAITESDGKIEGVLSKKVNG